MIAPLIRVAALRLGAEFETAITKRRAVILERIHGTDGIMCAFADGLTKILHSDIKVRPIATIH